LPPQRARIARKPQRAKIVGQVADARVRLAQLHLGHELAHVGFLRTVSPFTASAKPAPHGLDAAFCSIVCVLRADGHAGLRGRELQAWLCQVAHALHVPRVVGRGDDRQQVV
jgi:hypothetical protein